MNIDKAIKTFKALKTGGSMVYHTGYISLDRQHTDFSGDLTPAAKLLDEVADLFWKYHSCGIAMLVQRRKETSFDVVNGPFIHEYIAVKK